MSRLVEPEWENSLNCNTQQQHTEPDLGKKVYRKCFYSRRQPSTQRATTSLRKPRGKASVGVRSKDPAATVRSRKKRADLERRVDVLLGVIKPTDLTRSVVTNDALLLQKDNSKKLAAKEAIMDEDEDESGMRTPPPRRESGGWDMGLRTPESNPRTPESF